MDDLEYLRMDMEDLGALGTTLAPHHSASNSFDDTFLGA
jgi:hypothetical protein